MKLTTYAKYTENVLYNVWLIVCAVIGLKYKTN